MKRGSGKIQGDSNICEQVWRSGWRREAAEPKPRPLTVAVFIRWLRQRGFHDSANIIRQVAMKNGVREIENCLQLILPAIRKLEKPR
jgi:hypothetical protein